MDKRLASLEKELGLKDPVEHAEYAKARMEDIIEQLQSKENEKKQMQLRMEELIEIVKPIGKQAVELQTKAKAAKRRLQCGTKADSSKQPKPRTDKRKGR